jgi:hypothetical protein
MSLGHDENFLDPSFTDVFRNQDAGNVSYIAASGDTGGQISAPAVDSEVLSVGGTFLTVDADGNRIAEEAWVEGGGGTSQVFDRPDYQDNLDLQGAAIGDFRVVPDVAYNADPASGVAVYSTTRDTSGNTGWSQVGGTSAGSPQWSGLVALVNEKRLQKGLDMLGSGQINNFVYGIARKYTNTVFHDITTGNNTLHPATPGFDQATGWGTPIATPLIERLSSEVPRSSRVSERNRVHFEWQANFAKSLLFGLPGNAVTNYEGIGTAIWDPQNVDFRMQQGFPDKNTGLFPIFLDQIDFDARGLERIGNTIDGLGLVQVLTQDGFPATLTVRFIGRIFRANGEDKITGEFFAVSARGKRLRVGEDPVLSGVFSSEGDSDLQF